MLKKININEKLYNEIIEYCNYNNIQDYEKEFNNFLLIGFNIQKYNTSPFASSPYLVEEKPQINIEKEEKEVIVEPSEKPLDIVQKEEKVIKKKKVRIIKN